MAYEYQKYKGKKTVYQYDPTKKSLQPFTGDWSEEAFKKKTGVGWGGVTTHEGLAVEQAMKALGATFGPGIGVPSAPVVKKEVPATVPEEGAPPLAIKGISSPPSGWETERVIASFQRHIGRTPTEAEVQRIQREEITGSGMKRTPEFGYKPKEVPTDQPTEAPLKTYFPIGKDFYDATTGEWISPTEWAKPEWRGAKPISQPEGVEAVGGPELGKVLEDLTEKMPESYMDAWNKFLEDSGLKDKLGEVKTALGEVKTAYEELPSMADLLAESRTARGLDDEVTRLNELDISLNEMDTTIKNTEDSIREQYKGSKITENQIRRLVNAEISPIASDYRDLLAERNTLAANLQRGEALATQEAQAKYSASLTSIKGAEAQYGGLKDIYSLARLGLAPGFTAMQADLERTFKESDEGIKAIRDLMAEYPTAEILETDTYTEAINKAALVAPGEIPKALGLQTDAAGNVTVVLQDPETGEITTEDVGLIGKREKPTAAKETGLTKSKLDTLAATGVPPDVAKVIHQGFRDGYSDEEIRSYLEMNGYDPGLVKVYKDVMARAVGEPILYEP